MRAYTRRIKKPDPAHGETILIERSLFDDLIRIAEQVSKVQALDEPTRKQRMTIEGGNRQFTCETTYFTDNGEVLIATEQAEGGSPLESLIAASRAFHKKLDEWTR